MPDLLVLLLLSFISASLCVPRPSQEDIAKRHTRRTEHGIHIPIVQQVNSSPQKRGLVGSIGLGDYADITYNVLVTVGGVTAPLTLDTGSSDLIVLSDACTTGCSGKVPLYPQSTFQSVGLSLLLEYGDSNSRTYALGLIGKDTVDLAGLTLSDQYFGAINNTNLTLANTGSSGIFGLSFPYISKIFAKVFESQQMSTRSLVERELAALAEFNTSNSAKTQSSTFFPRDEGSKKTPETGLNLYMPSFPHLSDTLKKASGKLTRSTPATLLFQSYQGIGPLLSRLVTAGQLHSPMFAVALQRDSVYIGGNLGMLSIGELPSGVNNDSLTWAPVRLYSNDMTGLEPPEDSPNEEYPIAWEVYVDDVFLDGVRLPRSNLSSSSIALSALVDTGNSLIRGPDDVIKTIDSMIGNQFRCNEPHTLAFQIGGKMFPVDPRDFVRQAYEKDLSTCTSSLTSTDPPGEDGRYLFSWSLGVPFLKGVLSAYHYGNLSYPSHDLPRMGFSSTVPSDADKKLVAAVQAASKEGNNFPAITESAPSGTPTPATTKSNGVAAATAVPGKTSGAIPMFSLGFSWLFCVLLAIIWII